MLRKLIAGFVCATISITFFACSSVQQSSDDTGKINVSVTFNALYEFVKAVGGDKVAISTIIPDGTEPHDFEPKAQDLSGLSKAQIFVMNGLGMESWAADAVKASGNSNLIIVDASNGVATITNAEAAGTKSQTDPHIWLSVTCAVTEVMNIKNALISADPANKAYYEANCKAYTAQLENLYVDYSAKFAGVQNTSFVTGHAAFAYLCRDFGLVQNSVEDVFAEGEPSARQMAALIDYCKAKHVTTIFSEALMSTDIADTLARETGAKVKAIYTIESNEDDKTYIERMDENLKVIFESMTEY